MSGRTGRTPAALERAFLALDRGMGGGNPPPAVLAFAARYPAGCATVLALLVALLAGDFSVLRTVLVGTCAWLLFWAILHAERRRQARYTRIGYDTVDTVSGGSRGALTGTLVAWGPVTVFIWLVGRMNDDPPSWTASAVFGALFVVCGHFGDRLRERRRARARAAADQEAR
ncbi:hypothetical protein JHN63_28760 [Streptomyces sp. MBT65]|uniref:hypothetical protein n=1 Tax=Streptomyces sp. MBT65 TaxID=1488395 RepID=UPI00190B25FE|nr:hypothetical protein [Streptomyces sp. MBT65]MBK3577720.1 hypothetical protein [Streptomyces sp. MBT65]